jgi:protease YdgD
MAMQQIGGAIALSVLGVMWATVQIGSSAQTEVRSKLTVQVATASNPKQLIQGDGYIPTDLQKSSNPAEGSRNIFGKDDRIPMVSMSYPWSAIGRVEGEIDSNTMSTCTGTLIAQNLVVTNAHCVFGENGKAHRLMSFAPNMINERSRDRADVVSVLVGTNQPDNEPTKDWAILKLNQPLGRKYGWMQWVSADVETLTELRGKFVLAGYSSDFPKNRGGSTAGVHLGCSIRGFEPNFGLAMHDCDMTSGASGGAIFTISDKGVGKIVALNVAERRNPEGKYPRRFSRETANYAVLTREWAGAAQELRAQVQR